MKGQCCLPCRCKTPADGSGRDAGGRGHAIITYDVPVSTAVCDWCSAPQCAPVGAVGPFLVSRAADELRCTAAPDPACACAPAGPAGSDPAGRGCQPACGGVASQHKYMQWAQAICINWNVVLRLVGPSAAGDRNGSAGGLADQPDPPHTACHAKLQVWCITCIFSLRLVAAFAPVVAATRCQAARRSRHSRARQQVVATHVIRCKWPAPLHVLGCKATAG